jgi:predicted ATPase
MAAGHGGQVLVSAATRALIDDTVALRDLGPHRLKDMTAPQHLFQLGEGEFPPPRSLNRTNLPVAASALVGRERELEELVSLLSDGTRLVTITGAGGTGKTRLALQAAAELTESFADGVFWVPLVAVKDPELVVPAIAETLDARGQLGDYVAEKDLLLLLDNAEHVVTSAPAIAEIVAAAPKLRVLVTSRAPLHVAAEYEYPLEPLRATDAVTLFVERARTAGRKLKADDTIAAICRRVDGLPLGIELAAARTKLLAPETLLERLDRALPLLKGGARDAPERQRTLEATIAWSYDLLDDEAKRVFRGLSAFTGTFAVDAAEEICDSDIESLDSLVDLGLAKALGNSRLILLETIREYATMLAEECDEANELRARHAGFYAQLAADAVPGLEQRNAGPAIERIAPELPNIRAALSHVAASDPPRALRLAVDLRRFWNARSPFEPLRLIESLYRPDLEPALRMAALGALAFFAMDSDEMEKAERYKREELALARSLGDLPTVRSALPVASLLARRAGDLEEADRLTAEGVELAQSAGDASLVGKLFWYRGAAELEAGGDVETALKWYERAVDAYASAADEHGTYWARLGVGDARCRLGQWEQAREPLARAVAYFHGSGEWKALANSVDHLAAVVAATGEASRAARLRGAGDALWTSMNVPLEHAYRPPHVEEAIATACAALGDDDYESARKVGESISLDELVATLNDA